MSILSGMDEFAKTLHAEAEAYCEAHGITLSDLSTEIFGHHKFFHRIADGKGCHISSYLRAKEHMKQPRNGAAA